MTARTVIRSSRVPFLILTPACVLVGISCAWSVQAPLSSWHILLVMLAAVAAHISVNALNEYEDFRSGLDLHTQRTPFSGGSGALPANPSAAPAVLWLGICTLLLCMLIGLYFLLQVGWPLLLFGLPGCLIITTYTRWINRSPLLCLLAPGIAFGPLMVGGTTLALTGTLPVAALWASVPVFFVVNNLLLLNQYPDIEADRAIGRVHWPIRYGIEASNRVYLLSLLGVFASLLSAVILGRLPVSALLSLTALAPAFFSYRGMRLLREKIASQPHYMAANVITAIALPTLLALGIFLG